MCRVLFKNSQDEGVLLDWRLGYSKEGHMASRWRSSRGYVDVLTMSEGGTWDDLVFKHAERALSLVDFAGSGLPGTSKGH